MDSSVLLFFEKMPQALPIYEAFTKRLLKELGPVQVKVQKSQIAFSNRYQFAFIWHPSRRFRGRKGRLYGCNVRSKSIAIEDSRIEAATEPYPNRWTHHVIVQSEDEIDDKLMGWIREAYEFCVGEIGKQPIRGN